MGVVVSLDQHRRARHADGAVHPGGAAVRAAFYFDLADPDTYLAAERVDLALPGVDWVPAARWVLPDGGQPASREHVAARATALRLPLTWPPRPDEPRPAAMRAAAYAAEQARGAPFVLAASRLAFCGGFDLDDPEVLAEAAAAAGLGLDEALHAAGDCARDLASEQAAIDLANEGCARLPAVRVGAALFCGEARIVEARHAARDARRARAAHGA